MDKIAFGNVTVQTLLLIAPIIIVYVSLVIFCLFKLAKDRVKYLPKWAWALIILCVSTFGPIIFLIFGRERD